MVSYATYYVKCWAQVLAMALHHLLTGKPRQAWALLVFWTRFVSLCPAQQGDVIQMFA